MSHNIDCISIYGKASDRFPPEVGYGLRIGGESPTKEAGHRGVLADLVYLCKWKLAGCFIVLLPV